MIIQRLTKTLSNLMLSFSLSLSASLLLSLSSMSKADTIALSLPLSGDFSEIGRDFSTGAKLAMETLGKGHELFIADDGCDKDLANQAVKDIRLIKPALVTGLICNETALAFANGFQESQLPLLVAGARSVRLIKDRDREDWNLWRMSPGDDAPADQIANYISSNLKDTAFALVDDGTIYGRNLTDGIRLRLNDSGMKPQFADTFRAAQSTQSGMLRRLERSGVGVAFIAATTTEDLFTIVKDHNAFNIKNQLIVTEQLAVLPYLEGASSVSNGTLIMMQQPHVSLKSTSKLTKLLETRNIASSKGIYDGYAAIEVAIASLGANHQDTTQNLSTKHFDTTLGAVEFDKYGKNIHNPYRLHVWQDGTLEPLDNSNNL